MRRAITTLLRACLCAVALLLGVAPSASPSQNETTLVYVFAGQSNMLGKDTAAWELATFAPDALKPSPDVLFWGPTADAPQAWVPLEAPTEMVEPGSHAGFGPELGAGPHLSRLHPGSRIAVVKYASGGTSLHHDWDPARPGSLYHRTMRRLRTAVSALRPQAPGTVRVAGFFWMQGETDSHSLEDAAAYAENLAAFVRAVRRDLGEPQLPFVVGRIADLGRRDPDRFPHTSVVRRAQREVARATHNVHLVSTDGLPLSRSRIHFTSHGTHELGRRFVDPSFGL